MKETYKFSPPKQIESSVTLVREDPAARTARRLKMIILILLLAILAFIVYIYSTDILRLVIELVKKHPNIPATPICPREVHRITVPTAVLYGRAALNEHPDTSDLVPLYILHKGDSVEDLCEWHQFPYHDNYLCRIPHYIWPEGTTMVHVGYYHATDGAGEWREGWVLSYQISWR